MPKNNYLKLSLILAFISLIGILFPVFARAEIIDVQVVASEDDGFEYINNGDTNSTSDFNFIISSVVSAGRYFTILIWDVAIPQGSTINVATSSVYVRGTYWDDADTYIYFEKTASPASVSAVYQNISQRSTTTASVSWVEAELGEGWHDTPSLVEPLQEVVDSFTTTRLAMIFRPYVHSPSYTLHLQSYDSSNIYGAKLHIEYTSGGSDTTPPVRSNGQPTGTLSAGTTQTTISLTTNEIATCKYGSVANQSYDSIANTFSVTGSTAHSATVTGLTSGTTYTYYVRCQDVSVNKNTDDFQISFSIANPVVVATNWSNADTIYYDLAQDDPINGFLGQAANELETYLEQMSGRSWSVVNNDPGGFVIRLQVNAAAPEFAGRGDEAQRIISDSNGVRIIGKTPIAVREGAYTFLDRLGVRWFFKDSAWTIVPNTLINPGSFDQIQEPDFFSRVLRFYPNINGGDSTTEQWLIRNRMGGNKWYRAAENFRYIYPSSNYATDPASFLPTDMGAVLGYPWQLNPTSQNVINAAINYVRDLLEAAPIIPSGIVSTDRLEYSGVPVIPNDGDITGWNPPYDNWQAITDVYYGLLNTVADNIRADYPDNYVLGLSYTEYAGVPSQSLSSNILVYLVTNYNYTSLTWNERVNGLRAKGIKLGVYDFYDVWVWWHDNPVVKLDFAALLPTYHNSGIDAFYAENGDNWGVKGIAYYVASRLLWDTSLSVEDILSDFYTKAFSPAATIMQEYFQNPYQTGQNFQRLAEAESLAAGNEAILARLRQLEYYQRFYWKYHVIGLSNLSLDELKSFYTFLTKIRDLSIVTYDFDEPAVRAVLKNRGLSDSDINALQNFTPPTNQEASEYLNEALAAFTNSPSVINIYTSSFEALGNTSNPVLDPLVGLSREVFFTSNGNETITVRAKSGFGSSEGADVTVNLYGGMTWYNYNSPMMSPIESKTIHILKSAWNSTTFYVSSPGLYKVTITGDTYVGAAIDVIGHPAAILASTARVFWGPQSNYFYVPEGTTVFSFTAESESGTTGNLIGPNGSSVVSINIPSGSTIDYPVNSPSPGLWKFILTSDYACNIKNLTGIPPFIWHDAQYLLVESGTATIPPVLPVTYALGDLNEDEKVNLLDVSILLSRWGSVNLDDLTLADINAGPSNISQGKIDLFDANLIMKNWRP